MGSQWGAHCKVEPIDRAQPCLQPASPCRWSPKQSLPHTGPAAMSIALLASAAARLTRLAPLVQHCAAGIQQNGALHPAVMQSQRGRHADPGVGPAGRFAVALALAAAAMPVAAAAAAQEPQQRDASSSRPSGALAALTEEGLTNHPLDYDPITNEHTARMTLAKKAALEAYQAGRYKEAERRFLEALEEAKLGFPPGDPHVPSARNNLAEFYRNIRRYDDAQRLLEEAVRELHEELGEKHWLYASALINLALLHEAKGDLQQAQQLLEKALSVRAKLFSTNSFVYADTAFALARVLVALGGRREQQRASALMKQAVRIVEDSGNVEGTPIVEWQLALAELERTMRQPKDAVETLRRGMYHMEELHGDLTAQASEVNERLSDALLVCGDAAAARNIMRRCVEARTHLFGHHLVVAASMVRLAALELGSPAQPDAAQRAEHFAGSAVAIAGDALQEARGRSPAAWMPQGLASWLGYGGSKGKGGDGGQQEVAVDRLRAALELARAYQVLAQAKQHSSQEDVPRARSEAEAALRNAVAVLREAQTIGAEELKDMSARLGEQHQAVEKASSLLVDTKLLLLELLDALADCIKQQQDGMAPASQQQAADWTPEEVRALLLEAELLAGELYGD